MKHIIIFLVFICISLSAFGQNEFNYKAVIKDVNGNVIANDLIQVQFTILEDQVEVYKETHTPTTDSNGIIIINIGGGTPISGNFSELAYYTTQHFLNVQINTGNGFVDMGTTALKAVPYASYAQLAPTNSYVTFPKFYDYNYSDFTILGDGRLRVVIDFNISMDQSSFVIGDSFTITGAGGSGTGSIVWSHQSTRLVFTSNEDFIDIAPCFTGGLTLTIKGFGANKVKDINGRTIDGNLDGYPGGAWSIRFDIVC